MKITAIQFFQVWLETVRNQQDELKSIWQKPRAFTSAIRHNEGSVLHEIKAKLNLECYHADYYALDAILYHEEDLITTRPNDSTWVTGIAVAFEHENYFTSGLFKEVSHLLITNADLRVLVTYPPNGDVEKEELDKLHVIIKDSRQSKERSEKEDFLLILGYERDFSWHGYIYKEEKWTRIENPTN